MISFLLQSASSEKSINILIFQIQKYVRKKQISEMCRDSLETNTLNTRFTQYTPLSNKKEDQQTERQKTSPIISKHIHDPSSEKTK
jgi:hypothetical protein